MGLVLQREPSSLLYARSAACRGPAAVAPWLRGGKRTVRYVPVRPGKSDDITLLTD